MKYESWLLLCIFNWILNCEWNFAKIIGTVEDMMMLRKKCFVFFWMNECVCTVLSTVCSCDSKQRRWPFLERIFMLRFASLQQKKQKKHELPWCTYPSLLSTTGLKHCYSGNKVLQGYHKQVRTASTVRRGDTGQDTDQVNMIYLFFFMWPLLTTLPEQGLFVPHPSTGLSHNNDMYCV